MRLQKADQVKTLPSNMAQMLEAIETTTSRDRRQIETKCAIRRMCQVLRRSPANVPCDPARLRELMAGASPASQGVSKALWSRYKSLTLAALRDFGIDTMPGRDVCGRSPAWKALEGTIPTQKLKFGPSRFMSHCSRLEVTPEAVSEETFADFHEALRLRSLQLKPEAIYRQTVRLWNKAVDTVPGWPQMPISDVACECFYSLPWADFPASFVADVDAFLATSGCLDEFSPDYALRIQPTTAALYRSRFRQLASLLVHSGKPAEDVIDLSVLTSLDNATAALKGMRDRSGKIPVSLAGHARLLATVARRWNKDEARAGSLNALAGRFKGRKKGMTEKNQSRLRQFELKANVDTLLLFADRAFEKARRENLGTQQEARRVMFALVIELLIAAPMRIRNLARLEECRHFVQFGRGRFRRRHIIIPGDEVKNGQAFEVALPPRICTRLDTYLRVYRPRLCDEPSHYLFPGERGFPKNASAFSSAISKFILRETGLVMNAHLFRSLAGKLHLDAHPSDLETVRRILGHKSSEMTASYYVEHRTVQAFRAYDTTIEGLIQKAGKIERSAALRKLSAIKPPAPLPSPDASAAPLPNEVA